MKTKTVKPTKKYQPKGWPRFVSGTLKRSLRFQRTRRSRWAIWSSGIKRGRVVPHESMPNDEIIYQIEQGWREYLRPSEARRICPAGFKEAMRK